MRPIPRRGKPARYLQVANAPTGSRQVEFSQLPTLDIAGTPTHLATEDEAIGLITAAARNSSGTPLAVCSMNLDHVHHFRTTRHDVPAEYKANRSTAHHGVAWLNLIDGAPIAAQTRRITGIRYPKLSGSDLIVPLLDAAAELTLRVGILGGMPDITEDVAARLRQGWPGLELAGHWTPPRTVLDSPNECTQLAEEIAEARVNILLVCLGKPRQERWISTYGDKTQARALLAFGAVVDFLGGHVSRAPGWVSRAGMEWLWRLAMEPRRLARRYLVQGPGAYLRVRRSRSYRPAQPPRRTGT